MPHDDHWLDFFGISFIIVAFSAIQIIFTSLVFVFFHDCQVFSVCVCVCVFRVKCTVFVFFHPSQVFYVCVLSLRSNVLSEYSFITVKCAVCILSSESNVYWVYSFTTAEFSMCAFFSKQSNVFVFVRSFSLVKCSYNHVILAWFSCQCHGLYPRLVCVCVFIIYNVYL